MTIAMKYSDKILYQVNYINSLLQGYNEKPIFDNTSFIIDKMSWNEYLKVSFNRSERISFEVIFSSNDFQINIDRTNEALDISSNYFDNNKTIIKGFLDFLFTCRSKVEYCGSNYTKIYFYNDSGKCVKTLKYVTGFYLKIGCQTKEYPPIYTK
jgi:hypothetical protein